MSVLLTESLLSKAAGWEAMKRARAYLAQGQVLSSYWAPPLLRGVVQAGEMSFRASMVIKSEIDVENLCTCRESREWGKICAHSVGVGLHWLQQQQPAATPSPVSPAGPAATTAGRPPASGAKRGTGLRRDPGGQAAELALITPPDLPQAIARGKVMLVLEAITGGRRSPLNALPKDRAFCFAAGEDAILEWLEEHAQGQTPAVLQVSAKELAGLLPLLVDHPRVTLGRGTAVKVSRAPLAIRLEASLEPSGEIVLKGSGWEGLVRLEDWAWTGTGFQPLNLAGGLAGLVAGPVRIGRNEVPRFLSQEWPRLQASGANLEANFELGQFVLEPQAPRFSLELRGGLAQLTAVMQCIYGQRILTPGVTSAEDSVWLPDPQVPTRYSTRDLAAERAGLTRLQRSGFTGPDAQGKLQMVGQNAVLNFFAREYPRLEREWEVTLEERLERSSRQNIERVEPRFQITSSGVQWFDLGVVFSTSGGESFASAEIQRLLLSGQSHTRLKNGKFAVIDTESVAELQEVLRDCAPEQHAGGYRIQEQQAAFLESTLRQNPNWRVEAPAAWRQRAASRGGEARLECPPLGDLDGVLRPYQKAGVAWLRFLREHGFGGILADEMGLGKTVQALAFLRWVRETGGGKGPMLVVCPTSLVFNWMAEAARFTPSMKVLALHGPERHEDFERVATQDLVITSYALIRRDAERYRELQFDTVLLDEAQHIKNRQTQNAQAVKAVRARHRVVLTGTPLENSVSDLWSIFDFLMPGYLGTAQDFRERYELPIARERHAPTQARLGRRLRPFLLRRLKREVVAELPDKLEQVAYCELGPEQKQLYQQLLESTRKEVLAAEGEQGLARSRMVVLNALLRLRQVCCDLRLLKLQGVPAKAASGKMDLFGELLEEVLDGGHRVLVFSQFVSMLTLLRERLSEEGIEYCYLDGSTTDRGSVVRRFQEESKVPVFLISLKAGGVGLNLTGADTVIHFDPWWNPAVEDQATDRAHRIGQTRVVTSYKLITRDTVEEKILALQKRKREVIQATIAGEEEFSAALTWEEIQELLA